jgi:hypothetical protein
MVASNEVTFDIRAQRAKLAEDLRAGEKDIVDSAKRTAMAATTAANAAAKSDPFNLQFDRKTTGDNVSRAMGEILLKVREEARQQKIILDVQTRLSGGATGNLDAEEKARFAETKNTPLFGAAGADSVTRAASLYSTIRQTAHVFVAVEASVAAINVGMNTAHLVSAAINHDYEGQVKSAAEVADAIKQIPFVGNQILSIGATINKYTIELVTHEQEYAAATRAAAEEQDKHTTKLQKRNQELAKSVEHAVQIEKSAERTAARAGRTPTQSAVLEAQDKLSDFNAELEKDTRQQGRKPVAEELAAQKAMEAAVNTARVEDNKATLEVIKKNEQKGLDEFVKDQEKREKAKKDAADEELRQLESLYASSARIRDNDLRAAGQTYEADKEKYEAAMDEKIAKAKTAAEKTQFEAEKQSGIADMERDRARKRDDIDFDTHERELQRSGHGNQADVDAIVRKAKEQVTASGGDSATQDAIVKNAMEQVLDLKPQHVEAVVTSASSAARQNLFGGGGNDDLTKTQKEALAILKSIRDKIGPSRVS